MATTTPDILVVDDEPEVCWALSQLFYVKGYRACAVQSGAEALAQLARKAFTHILLDAKLQDWDGLALAAEVRTRNPGAVVLLISAYFYRDEPDIARALAAGRIDGFISKPFTHAEILHCVAPQVGE